MWIHILFNIGGLTPKLASKVGLYATKILLSGQYLCTVLSHPE